MCGTALQSSTVAMVRNRSRRVISSRVRDAYCELKDEAKIGSSSQASALFLGIRGPINDQVPFLVMLCRSVETLWLEKMPTSLWRVAKDCRRPR